MKLYVYAAKFLSQSATEGILIVYQKIAPDKKVCPSLSLFLVLNKIQDNRKKDYKHLSFGIVCLILKVWW